MYGIIGDIQNPNVVMANGQADRVGELLMLMEALPRCVGGERGEGRREGREGRILGTLGSGGLGPWGPGGRGRLPGAMGPGVRGDASGGPGVRGACPGGPLPRPPLPPSSSSSLPSSLEAGVSDVRRGQGQ